MLKEQRCSAVKAADLCVTASLSSIPDGKCEKVYVHALDIASLRSE